MTKVDKIVCYLKDPRPDLLPAFKQLLKPECKLPIWQFVVYLANLGINKIPGLRKLTSHERQVSFATYMLAYDRTAGSFVPYKELLARVAELVNPISGETVVDLGAGTGNLTKAVKLRGGKVYSIDSSPEANQIHRTKNPEAEIFEVNIDRPDSVTGFLPFADHSVERVCAANLWTYIKNRSTLYAEVRRILAPGGYFVLAVERVSYSPLAILKEHLKKEYDRHIAAQEMPLTACLKVYTAFIERYDDLMVTMSQTKKLMRGIVAGDYVVFDEATIREELNQNGFEVISSEIAYAGQNIILVARPRH